MSYTYPCLTGEETKAQRTERLRELFKLTQVTENGARNCIHASWLQYVPDEELHHQRLHFSITLLPSPARLQSCKFY
jgi:hypothetical protein